MGNYNGQETSCPFRFYAEKRLPLEASARLWYNYFDSIYHFLSPAQPVWRAYTDERI